jgi:hypothetical protein
LHRAIGASDPRLPAGQLIQPQRRASESVTVPWAQECAFNYDVRLKGQFCKIVGGEMMPPCGVPLRVSPYRQSSMYPALSMLDMRRSSRLSRTLSDSVPNRTSWSMLSNEH